MCQTLSAGVTGLLFEFVFAFYCLTQPQTKDPAATPRYAGHLDHPKDPFARIYEAYGSLAGPIRFCKGAGKSANPAEQCCDKRHSFLAADACYPACKTSSGKRRVSSGMVKVARSADNELFRIGVLPHRFYLSRTDAAAEDSPTATSKLHLCVRCGKLTVLDSDLVEG
jgi:hypothetical protein